MDASSEYVRHSFVRVTMPSSGSLNIDKCEVLSPAKIPSGWMSAPMDKAKR